MLLSDMARFHGDPVYALGLKCMMSEEVLKVVGDVTILNTFLPWAEVWVEANSGRLKIAKKKISKDVRKRKLLFMNSKLISIKNFCRF